MKANPHVSSFRCTILFIVNYLSYNNSLAYCCGRPALEYCRHDVPSCSTAAAVSCYLTGPASASSGTDIDARKTAAAARLPWQAMRVCIVALAPTLTFVGAVRVVEDALQRACRKHSVSGRDSPGTSSCSGIGDLDLLICAGE